MAEQEAREFKQIIRAVLGALPRTTTEKDLRKAYREQEGENINVKVEKFLNVAYTDKQQHHYNILWSYLRYQCQDICSIFRLDNEIKIQRVASENTQHLDTMSKANKRKPKKTNTAPKLK